MELSPVHLLTLPPFYIYVGHLPLKHFFGSQGAIDDSCSLYYSYGTIAGTWLPAIPPF